MIRLFDGKGTREAQVEHLLPVTPSMEQKLDLLKQINWNGPFIFSSSGGTKPFHNRTITHLVNLVAERFEMILHETLKLANDEPYAQFTAGDIRRSVETRMQSFGISKEIRAQTLSHGRSSGVQAQHYEQYEFLTEKQDALQRRQMHLSSVIDGTYVSPTTVKPKFSRRV